LYFTVSAAHTADEAAAHAAAQAAAPTNTFLEAISQLRREIERWGFHLNSNKN